MLVQLLKFYWLNITTKVDTKGRKLSTHTFVDQAFLQVAEDEAVGGQVQPHLIWLIFRALVDTAGNITLANRSDILIFDL